ncbi:MAG: lysophospholipid acyltransferase family protein [Bdellovibrionales bacterium]
MRWLLSPARGLAWLIQAMPWKMQKALAWGMGIFWFDLLRIRRQVVIDNLGIAFPQMSYSERVKIGRRAMANFCFNVVEYARLPFLGAEDIDQFRFYGREHVEKARLQGKGVLLLTLHLGNGDLASAGLALLGWPMHLISKTFKTEWLNDAWFGMREKVGMKFIPPRNSSYGILKALKKNEIVIFVLDQFTGPPIGVKTMFFGRETGTALGLAVMAHRSGAAVVPAYTLRREDGRTDVFCEPAIEYVEGPDHDESLARMTQVYTDHLEQYVRMCPEQWMWLHKRWKKFKY